MICVVAVVNLPCNVEVVVVLKGFVVVEGFQGVLVEFNITGEERVVW